MAVVDNIVAFAGGNISTGDTGLIVTDESGNVLYKALYPVLTPAEYNITDVAIDGYNNVYTVTNDWNNNQSSFGQSKLVKTSAGGTVLATKDESSYFYEYASVRYADNDIVLTEKSTVGGDYKLVKFDKDNLTKTFETTTTDYVNNMDLDKNGYAYIAHSDSLKKYDTTGSSSSLVWTSFSSQAVRGLHVAEDGGALSIVAQDTGVYYPYFIDPSNGSTDLKITAASGALSSVVYSDDQMGVVLPSAVRKYNAAGTQQWSTTKTTYNTVKRATVDSSDTLWVGASDTVYNGWDSSGTAMTNSVTTAGSTTEVSARNAWWGAYYRNSVDVTSSSSGAAYLTTAQYKYGHTSLFGNNTGWLKADSLVIPQTGEFTIECWFRSNGAWSSGYTTLFSNYDSAISNGSFHVSVFQNQLNVFVKDTVNGNFSYAGTSASTGTWHHIALQRNGSNQMSIYFNGSRIYHDTSQPTSINNNNIYIGGREFGYLAPTYLKCYIDEVRLSNVSRYSGTTYTPSTTIYTADANSLLLMHYEGNNNDQIFYDDNSYIDFNEPTQNFINLNATMATAATLAFAKTLYRTLATTVTSAASLVKQSSLSKLLSASVSSAASLAATKQIYRTLTGLVSTTASLSLSSVYSRVLSTTVSAVASLSSIKTKLVNLVVNVTSTASLSSVMSYVRTLTANVTSTASLNIASIILRFLSAGVSVSTSTSKQVGKAVNATVSAISDAYRQLPNVAIAAAVAITASLQKVVTKAVDAQVSSTSSVQKAITKGINASVNAIESVGKAVGKTVNAAVSSVASIQRVINKNINAIVTAFSGIAKRVNAALRLAAGVVVNGTMQKVVGKALNDTVSNTINIVKYVAKSISEVIISTEAITRPIIKIYETLMTLSVISYLRERVTDILRKTSDTSTDTTHPTETNTFRKEDDA